MLRRPPRSTQRYVYAVCESHIYKYFLYACTVVTNVFKKITYIQIQKVPGTFVKYTFDFMVHTALSIQFYDKLQ
jgi:hypothetical protein